MQRVEFHCHTRYSRDSLLEPASLLAACRRKHIDRLVVTDHNTIEGALACQKLDPQRVIIGEEILTTGGELLAAFVKESIPPGLAPLEAIERLREQGAFISVSHPFDSLRKGAWELATLLEITPLVDAIEIFNSRCFTSAANNQAQEFARQHQLLGTAGSDAHTAFELGRALMVLPDFQDVPGLKEALKQAKIQARLSSPWVHMSSRYAVWAKQRRGE
jgi:hypothetical protein